jgi:hypothetical protein
VGILLPRRLQGMIEAGQIAPDSVQGSQTWASWLASQPPGD